MKTIILVLLACTFAFPQEKETANNNIYLELLGNGLFSSLNYEYTISNNFTMRFGVGFAFSNSESNSGGHHTTSFLPLAMGNYLIDFYGNNYFEIGGGFLIVPGLVGATSMPLLNAIGSSLVSVAAFGATAAISYAISGLVNWTVALLFIVGGALGGMAGVRIANHLSTRKRTLSIVFSAVVAVVGLYVVMRGIEG